MYWHVLISIRHILNSININLINYFMRCETFFVEHILFMQYLHFLDVVWISYKHIRLYRFHRIPLLCDHRELACTPKDPPRRFIWKNESTKLFSYIRTSIVFRQNSLNTYCWRTVWKPHMCFYILIKWIMWIECMFGGLRLGRLGKPLGGSWGNWVACNHLPGLQDIE